jgi:RNase adaptor protein for sRNA GlmZ degradation
MTVDELANALKERYEQAGKREVVLAIHLFGIKYARELDGHSINDVAELGTGHRSYGTEFRKGMRLAQYVNLRES